MISSSAPSDIIAVIEEIEADHWRTLWGLADAILRDIPWSDNPRDDHRVRADLKALAQQLRSSDRYHVLWHHTSRQADNGATLGEVVRRLTALRAAAHGFRPGDRDPTINVEHYIHAGSPDVLRAARDFASENGGPLKLAIDYLLAFSGRPSARSRDVKDCAKPYLKNRR
jgi:hypothetical protein